MWSGTVLITCALWLRTEVVGAAKPDISEVIGGAWKIRKTGGLACSMNEPFLTKFVSGVVVAH
jgi:hypothetical protein